MVLTQGFLGEGIKILELQSSEGLIELERVLPNLLVQLLTRGLSCFTTWVYSSPKDCSQYSILILPVQMTREGLRQKPGTMWKETQEDRDYWEEGSLQASYQRLRLYSRREELCRQKNTITLSYLPDAISYRYIHS